MRQSPEPDRSRPCDAPAPRRPSWRGPAESGLLVYCAGCLLVMAGVAVGISTEEGRHPQSPRRMPACGDRVLDAANQWDAQWFLSIADNGYQYNPNETSRVAFFPAYPAAVAVANRILGLRVEVAGLLVAHACLIGAFVLFARYLGIRGPEGTSAEGTTGNRKVETYALWAFALMPTTFFFRMPYSEAMFVLVALAALLGMQQRWPLVWVAAICGLATAVRPVGVALLAPLVWYAWRERQGKRGEADASEGDRRSETASHEVGRRSETASYGGCAAHGVCRVLWAVPLGCWGLLAYMAYQQAAFGDALAFAKTQAHWHVRDYGGTADKLLALASWEPVWSVYVPDTPAYFGGFTGGHWWRAMRFFNPLFFCGTAALGVVGAWKRWLTVPEVLLSVGLLAIPYVTRAYEMCMESQARFAAVALPAYIVLGRLLAALPRPLAWALLAVGGFGLGFFAARYAAGAMYY